MDEIFDGDSEKENSSGDNSDDQENNPNEGSKEESDIQIEETNKSS